MCSYWYFIYVSHMILYILYLFYYLNIFSWRLFTVPETLLCPWDIFLSLIHISVPEIYFCLWDIFLSLRHFFALRHFCIPETIHVPERYFCPWYISIRYFIFRQIKLILIQEIEQIQQSSPKLQVEISLGYIIWIQVYFFYWIL